MTFTPHELTNALLAPQTTPVVNMFSEIIAWGGCKRDVVKRVKKMLKAEMPCNMFGKMFASGVTVMIEPGGVNLHQKLHASTVLKSLWPSIPPVFQTELV